MLFYEIRVAKSQWYLTTRLVKFAIIITKKTVHATHLHFRCHPLCLCELRFCRRLPGVS